MPDLPLRGATRAGIIEEKLGKMARRAPENRRSIMHEALWEKCVDFHGHACGGLALGYRAALYAAQLLDVTPAEDEELVCIAENDACGVDAIQVVLHCSVGKGNLLFHLTGKQAFSFYRRDTGASVRLVAGARPKGMTKQESRAHYLQSPAADLFAVTPVRLPLPEKAQNFESYPCAVCGELVAAPWIRLQDGQMRCLDCAVPYRRLDL